MRNIKIRLLLFASVVLVITILSMYFSVGYGMYIEGELVGIVHSHAEATAITEIFCKESNTESISPSLSLRFLKRDHFTSAAVILENARMAGGIETEVVTETVAIPFTEGTIEDATLYTGEKQVVNEGIDGSRIIVKEITKRNGEILREEILSDTVSAEPINKIVSIGTKPRPPGVGTGSFGLPLGEIAVSSAFGKRWNRQHNGVDLAADSGTAILAADTGTVTFSGTADGYGNLIILDHQNGYTTYYAHCSVLYATTGAMPEKGEVIAEVGSTGNSTGPHLHFEIRKNGEPQNPADYLPGTVL